MAVVKAAATADVTTVNPEHRVSLAEWFKSTRKDDDYKKLMRPAIDTVKRHEHRRATFKHYFKHRQIASTKEALQHQIDEINDPDLRTLQHAASAALEKANWGFKDYQLKRTHGVRKAGVTAQGFVKVFSDFFGAYSGVVDILKGADPVFGKTAYEALSIFLFVMVNKSGNDNGITDLLREIQRSFPHLEAFLALYPEPRIKKAVIQVYKNVIEFSAQASRYFTRLRTRIGMAIGNPPSMGIDRTAVIIQGSLAEVKGEAMVALHTRTLETNDVVKESRQKIDELMKENSELKRQVSTLIESMGQLTELNKRDRLEDAEEKLERLKEILGVKFPHETCDIPLCDQSHSQAFNHQISPTKRPRVAVHYTRMTWEILEGSPEYASWFESKNSSLLVLSGRTIRESRAARGYTHSWLSPAAVLVAQRLQDQGEVIAFFSCHSTPQAKRYYPEDLFFSVIYQILRQEMLVMHKASERLHALKKEHEDASDSDDKLKILIGQLKEVLRRVKKKVTIVLDCIEWIEHKLAAVMRQLVEIVLLEGMHVKVMVIIEPSGGNVNKTGIWDMESALERASNRELAKNRVYARLEWDQTQERVSTR